MLEVPIEDRAKSTVPVIAVRLLRLAALAGLLAAGSLAMPLAIAPTVSAQGTLDGLRQSVRAPDVPGPPREEPKRREPRKRSYGSDCDDEDDGWSSLLAPLMGPVVWATAAAMTSPFWGPASLMDDHYDAASYFPSYPYQQDVAGAMMKDPWVPAEPRMWSARLRGDYVDDFDAVSSIGGHVLWESSQRWGIDAEVRYRHEDLAWGGDSDELWTGDSNLLFRFAQSPRMQMRAGAGINWLADQDKRDFGLNFTYGGDWYPLRPFVVSAELDLGRLGRATYFHARATAGIQVRRYELFTGYDYFDVGTVQIQGLVSGLRITF